MPTNVAKEIRDAIKKLEAAFIAHLNEASAEKIAIGKMQTNIEWLKWINMGIAALVLFKLVVDWLK